MGTKRRRAARETALNVLYQIDVAKITVDEALATAMENTGLEGDAAEFTETLVRGVLAHVRELDKHVEGLAVGWEPQRFPAVDRSILRMAMFEILYLDHIPPSVSINEAVDMAKKYSTDESGKFINGVLGAFVRRAIEKSEEPDARKDS